ncbi:hypothetical protein BC939DRAFT_524622 [Gamsiella multidivaricata]|uniref:uncharacterized protein n=1 Tax=Gamsiella multidivaricata TaxID=101098 RepID=UPI0022208351|nr:uncharacterized protein BC939DRAFT_524622 [Gamsiella multidivaricata]KAI7832346.1 hypothetical protein BC939DRAFT_524622 [Gamsiella multidivaricata]
MIQSLVEQMKRQAEKQEEHANELMELKAASQETSKILHARLHSHPRLYQSYQHPHPHHTLTTCHELNNILSSNHHCPTAPTKLRVASFKSRRSNGRPYAKAAQHHTPSSFSDAHCQPQVSNINSRLPLTEESIELIQEQQSQTDTQRTGARHCRARSIPRSTTSSDIDIDDATNLVMRNATFKTFQLYELVHELSGTAAATLKPQRSKRARDDISAISDASTSGHGAMTLIMLLSNVATRNLQLIRMPWL